MSPSGEFIEVWCLSFEMKSGMVSLSEFSRESYDDHLGELISTVGLNEDMVICGLKETVLQCTVSFSKWRTTA